MARQKAEKEFRAVIAARQTRVLMARRFLYRPEDDIRLADGDPLPAVKGRKPLYVVWIAWPAMTINGDGYPYQNEAFHQQLYQRCVKELGWLETGRPRNEQIMPYYSCYEGDWVRFRMPNIPDSPLALTWVERFKGAWYNHVTPPNPHCPGCGLEYYGQAGQADHLCTVCFWRNNADTAG